MNFCCFGRGKPGSCNKQRRISFAESEASTRLDGKCEQGHDDSASETSIEDLQVDNDEQRTTFRREWLLADADAMAAEAKEEEQRQMKRIASCAAAAAVEQIVAVASEAAAQDKRRQAFIAAPRMAKLAAFKKSVEQRAASGPFSAGDLRDRLAAFPGRRGSS